MDKEVVFVADIADDIDDYIAIEYLANTGFLKCVVLDGQSRNHTRENELQKIGVSFEENIPKETKIIFCGGALSKVNKFVQTNKIDLLIANGGFAGVNIVKSDDVLAKFKNKEKVRTYNFNMDIDAALSVLSSTNIKDILLVSKNVCHSESNCIGGLHNEIFLHRYNLDKGKRLHDLLMAKEGINYILGNEMSCEYLSVSPICERKIPDNMSLWGSELNEKSNIKISISFNNNR